MSNYIITNGGELCHYGIPGMKWGRRKARPEATGMGRFRSSRVTQAPSPRQAYKAQQQQAKKAYKEEMNAYKQTPEYKAQRIAKAKTAAKIGAAAAGTALAAYGVYKVAKYVQNEKARKAGEQAVKDAIAKQMREQEYARQRFERMMRDATPGSRVYSGGGGAVFEGVKK